MIILWVLPLVVMTFTGMFLMLVRGRPKCLRSNMHQISVMGLTATSVLSLARLHIPDFDVVVMAWCASCIVVLSATREIARRKRTT